MSGHQSRRSLSLTAVVLPLVAAAGAGVVAVGASPASAHTHPTPIERAAPGVLYIEARAKVEVALIEHHQVGDPQGVHIGITQSTWNPVLGSASGFFVDPNGTIVTAGSVLKQDLERAKVYAVNQAFRERYGQAAPLPDDPFARQHIGPAEDRNEQRLQACYPPNRTNDAGGCVLKASLDLVVYPYVTSQQQYGQMQAEALPGAATADVAVLRVRGANSIPTVGLAPSMAGAKALAALGFTGVPGPKQPLVTIDAHLQTAGGSELKTTGLEPAEVKAAAALKEALNRGFAGGPLVAERGQVVGLVPAPAASGSPAPRLVTVATILESLKKAKVSPHGGPVDTSYETAMHLFKNGEYAASVPNFARALALFPGHFRAATNLATAKQQAAGQGGSTKPPALSAAGGESSTGVAGSPNWLVITLGVAGVLLIGAVSALVLQRRANAQPAGAGAGEPGGPRVPVPAVSRPPAPGPAGAGRADERSAHPSVPGNPAGPGGPATPPRPQPGSPPHGYPSRVAASQASARQVPAGQAAAGQAPARPAPTGQAAATQAPAGRAGAAQAGAAHAAPAQPSAAQAPITRFCTSCGGRLASSHRFCGWCGEPVE